VSARPDHPGIAALIPHAGRMCLLDDVLAWDADRIRCRTRSHLAGDHPLRDADGLKALHLCEYGAQAMAVHGGLLAGAAGGLAVPGLLAALRSVRLHASHVHELDGWLEVEAERLLDSGAGWLYAFRVLHQGRLLAEGRAIVIHPETAP